MLLQVAARFEFAASTGESYRRHGRYLIYCFLVDPFSLRLKKQLAAKKSSLQQAAATLPEAAATCYLVGVSAYKGGCYM